MIFDRADLRVLRMAYEQALKRLRQSKFVSESEREDLARTVLDLSWARLRRGLSLSGAETAIASEAFKLRTDHTALALCA